MADEISRRQLLAVASSSAVALGAVSSPASAAQGTERILQESFENAPERTRPSDWTKSGTGVAMVVVPDGGNSVAGSKIFGMFGNDDSCSSVSASHALNLQGRTWARFQVYVFPTDRGRDGCTSKRAGLSLHAGESESVSLVELTTDGTVRGPGSEPLGEYAKRTWNELVVEYDRSGETVQLTYIINGDSQGTISKPHHPAESDFSQLRLDTGVDIVWWDALKVTASPKTATPTQASDGSGAGSGSRDGAGEGANGGPAGRDGTDPIGDGPLIPGLGVFGWFVGTAGAIAAVIFVLVASVAASGLSGESNTQSSRRPTEDEVRGGLEDTEESLRDKRR